MLALIDWDDGSGRLSKPEYVGFRDVHLQFFGRALEEAIPEMG